MQFSRDHRKYLKNLYVIDKAFCDVAILLFAAGAVALSFHIFTSRLSEPPGSASNAREYIECRNASYDVPECLQSFHEGHGDDVDGGASRTGQQNVANTLFVEKRALYAQEGMWRATNALVELTIIQMWIGVATIFTVGWTLLQTRAMLRETKGATSAANKTADHAKIATELELQPYLSVHFVKCDTSPPQIRITRVTGIHDEHDRPADIYEPDSGPVFDFRIHIQNAGKTPASDLRVEFEGAAYVSLTSRQYGRRSFTGTFMPTGKSSGSLIAAGGEEQFTVRGQFATSPHSEDEPRYASNVAPASDFDVSQVEINALVIRYKDFSCKSLRHHKVIRGSVNHFVDQLGISSSQVSLSWVETEDDNSHEGYR